MLRVLWWVCQCQGAEPTPKGDRPWLQPCLQGNHSNISSNLWLFAIFSRKFLKSRLLVSYWYWPLNCQVCDKKFKTKYTLRSHEKVVHSDNMPFKCSKCDHRFKDKVISFAKREKNFCPGKHAEAPGQWWFPPAAWEGKAEWVQFSTKVRIKGRTLI